jgi:hypothetical protein
MAQAISTTCAYKQLQNGTLNRKADLPEVQTRTCLACHQSFVPQHRLQRYCTIICRTRPAPAVYRFIAPDGRSYVGSTCDRRKRVKGGICRRNPQLLQTFVTYPPETWAFEILQALPPGCPDFIRIRAEQQHIDRLRSWDPAHGFNMSPADYGVASPECREAHRAYMRQVDAVSRAKRAGARTLISIESAAEWRRQCEATADPDTDDSE